MALTNQATRPPERWPSTSPVGDHVNDVQLVEQPFGERAAGDAFVQDRGGSRNEADPQAGARAACRQAKVSINRSWTIAGICSTSESSRLPLGRGRAGC